jgi:hypothetical protein
VAAASAAAANSVAAANSASSAATTSLAEGSAAVRFDELRLLVRFFATAGAATGSVAPEPESTDGASTAGESTDGPALGPAGADDSARLAGRGDVRRRDDRPAFAGAAAPPSSEEPTPPACASSDDAGVPDVVVSTIEVRSSAVSTGTPVGPGYRPHRLGTARGA